jgi:hypothetical protein
MGNVVRVYVQGTISSYDGKNDTRHEMSSVACLLIMQPTYSNPQTTKFFQLDPQFPERLHTSGYTATLNFLLSMLEDYSRRGITEPSDRAIAISGLLARIEQVLPSRIYHGIVEWYLHRTLLWRRCNGQTSVKIRYESRNVPSWSWLAYPGPVAFCTTRHIFESLDVFHNLRVCEGSLCTTIWEVTNLGIGISEEGSGGEDYQYQLKDSNGMERGLISFDEEPAVPPVPNVAVLARHGKERDGFRYFVMFVRPRTSQGRYERLGIGMLDEECGLKAMGTGRIF